MPKSQATRTVNASVDSVNAGVIACPFCRETARDLVDVWRSQGYCSTCGRAFVVSDNKPAPCASGVRSK